MLCRLLLLIQRSVSSTNDANGPYTFEHEVLPPFAHNPTIRKVSDGYTIWFIGGWGMNASHCGGGGGSPSGGEDTAALTSKTPWGAAVHAHSRRPGGAGAGAGAGAGSGAGAGAGAGATCNGQSWDKSCGPNMPGPNKDCCGPCNSGYHANCGCGIATAHAATLAGPWKVQPLVITDQWESDDVYCTHTNPSPFVMANGTIVMAFNAGYCNNHLETIGLAVSDGGWAGPWRLLVKNSILKNPDGSAHKCEDPFVWQSKRGWHLIVHNQEGNVGNSESAYAFSEDGHAWTMAKTAPYDCTISFTDGTKATANGCGNRPQILFGEDGAPQLLTNGAFAANPNGGGNTYTLFRPLTTSATPATNAP